LNYALSEAKGQLPSNYTKLITIISMQIHADFKTLIYCRFFATSIPRRRRYHLCLL